MVRRREFDSPSTSSTRFLPCCLARSIAEVKRAKRLRDPGGSETRRELPPANVAEFKK